MASRQASATTATPGEFDTTTGLLIFYYVTLGFFLLVCLFVLGSFLFRVVFEHSVLRHGHAVEHGKFSSVCSVRVLQFTLWTAFGLLLGLFGAFWLFWGKLLATLSWRMQVVIARLAGESSIPPDAIKALGEAANRTFIVVVFFVLSISLNVLVLMRQLTNKTILLKTNNRASLFRVMHADLAEMSASRTVFRQLWMSFLFDVAELWTLATWSLYPIFVAVFWVLESSCIGSQLVLSTASLSPLIGCMFTARYHLLVVCVGWLGVVTACTLLYFLRFLDERRYLMGSTNARWWHLGPFVLMTCILFWAGLAATILAAIMMGKPLLSSSVNPDDRIFLAAPGVVLFCGNVLLLFHLGRKLAAAFAFRNNAKTSFFFEKGVPLTDKPEMKTFELESTPYVSVDEDLLY